jgi:hypothetical protein
MLASIESFPSLICNLKKVVLTGKRDSINLDAITLTPLAPIDCQGVGSLLPE